MSDRLQNILYLPLDGLFKLLSMMPMRALYLTADFMSLLLRDVVRYRRKVVIDNLSKCFPDKSEAEIKHIADDFYGNFADYFVETLKLRHISDEEMRRYMVVENQDYADKLLAEGQSVIAYFSHCGNWEWATSLTLWSRFGRDEKVVFGQVYRPLKNRWFDRFFLKLRTRFYGECFPKRTVLRSLIGLKRDGRPSMVGFMSDQKPSHGDPTLVLEFLNRPTAMITGTETLARKLGDAAVYMDMHKVGRGRYKIVIRPMADDCSQLESGELTRRYAALLQETIQRNPAIWLWSHKRWKNPVTLSMQPDDKQQ